MPTQGDTPREEKRKSSLIELYILPERHIKHLNDVSNLSVVLSGIFIIYSIVNIVLFYSTGECIRDNIDVWISIASIVIPIGFTMYIFFMEKLFYHADKIAPSQPHNNNPNIQNKPTK